MEGFKLNAVIGKFFRMRLVEFRHYLSKVILNVWKIIRLIVRHIKIEVLSNELINKFSIIIIPTKPPIQ